jgi:TonB family protein
LKGERFGVASTVVEQSPEKLTRRRSSRFRLKEPLEVTVLRSGVPDTVPGRSLDVSAGGVAAVLAGEVSPGENVAIELRLPGGATPLRTRARVRHYDKLQAGLEFVGLSAEQQSAIRGCAEKVKTELRPPVRTEPVPEIPRGIDLQAADSSQVPTRRRRLAGWISFFALVGILLAGGWWRWSHGWALLESGLPRNEDATVQPEAQVPAEAMQKLVRHRVDPEYPASARQENLQGVIVLDVIVGRDGSVVGVRAKNGPEVLAKAAEAALRWWRFEPYRMNGQPAVVETTVAVEFQP